MKHLASLGPASQSAAEEARSVAPPRARGKNGTSLLLAFFFFLFFKKKTCQLRIHIFHGSTNNFRLIEKLLLPNYCIDR